MIFFIHANFKLLIDHIVSLRLPKEYLNSHNCSFDINIVTFRDEQCSCKLMQIF